MRTLTLFSHNQSPGLRQNSAEGLALFLGIILLAGNLFYFTGKAPVSTDVPPETFQVSAKVPGVGESLLLSDFRLQMPDHRILYAIQIANSENLVLTRSQAACLLVVAFLRHPFYVFTSIHAP
jgi:hypothetical protein